MVLRLKTRESRSLPGLPSARSPHIRIDPDGDKSSLYDLKARQTGAWAAQAALSFGGS